MGTSSSSSGPGSGVPFDPPWLDSIIPYIENPIEPSPNEEEPPDQERHQSEFLFPPEPLAPARRFGRARRDIAEYVKTGDKNYLKKAMGSYSRNGMGGATNVAKRMKVATTAGANLFNFLQGIRNNSAPEVRVWINQLIERSLSIYEIADELVNQILPIGGSLDEESCKNAMSQAISELLNIEQDIDFMHMDDNHIWKIMELFIANEAFNRINLDIGQVFESAKYSPQEAVFRMNEMSEFLKSEISIQIKKLRAKSLNPSGNEINNILKSAIKITFEVFEEEI